MAVLVGRHAAEHGGLALLVLNSRWTLATRRNGTHAHWLVGFIVNGAGMVLIGAGWLFLAMLGPRLDATWPIGVGGLIAIGGTALYLSSASRVGRLRAPSAYSNDLDTSGLYALMRHPQASALALIALGLAGVSRSIPYLAATPLLVLGWYLYARLEEELELLPVFGARYEAYRHRTPALLPSLSGIAALLGSASTTRKANRRRYDAQG